MNPKVIVVMPAYNAEKTLERTVADIPKGSVDQIILVDDCSKDGTRKILTEEIAQYPECKIVFHEVNQGKGAALRRGFAVRCWNLPQQKH